MTHTQLTIPVQGMTCGGCEARVQKILETETGVMDVEASHEKAQVLVKFDPEQITPAQLVETIIDKAGYEAHLPE